MTIQNIAIVLSAGVLFAGAYVFVRDSADVIRSAVRFHRKHVKNKPPSSI